MTRLLDEACALLAAEELDTAAMVDLARRARQQPPQDAIEGAQLVAALDELSLRARSQLRELSGQMRRATHGRRALRGYGHLKGSRLAQRAFLTA